MSCGCSIISANCIHHTSVTVCYCRCPLPQWASMNCTVSVHPSVCLSRRSIAAATCSWFAAAYNSGAGGRYRSLFCRQQRAASCWEPRYEAQHRLVNNRSCSVQIVVLITLRLEVHSHRCLTACGAARCRASATRRTRPQYARSYRIRWHVGRLVAKFRYTGPTGPARTHKDFFCGPGLRETPLGPCGSPTKYVRVRSGPCSGI